MAPLYQARARTHNTAWFPVGVHIRGDEAAAPSTLVRHRRDLGRSLLPTHPPSSVVGTPFGMLRTSPTPRQRGFAPVHSPHRRTPTGAAGSTLRSGRWALGGWVGQNYRTGSGRATLSVPTQVNSHVGSDRMARLAARWYNPLISGEEQTVSNTSRLPRRTFLKISGGGAAALLAAACAPAAAPPAQPSSAPS